MLATALTCHGLSIYLLYLLFLYRLYLYLPVKCVDEELKVSVQAGDDTQYRGAWQESAQNKRATRGREASSSSKATTCVPSIHRSIHLFIHLQYLYRCQTGKHLLLTCTRR